MKPRKCPEKNKIGKEKESLIFSVRNGILNISGVSVELVLLVESD